MRLLFILQLSLLIVSCGKKHTSTTPFIRHSYYLNGEYHTSNELIRPGSNYQYSETVLPPTEKYCDLNFLLTGPGFSDSQSESNPEYAIEFSLNLIYGLNEIDANCSCLPKTTAPKLMGAFLSGTEWNNSSGPGPYKYLTLQRKPYLRNYSSSYFGIQVDAETIGDHLLLRGHVDSMIFTTPTNTDRFTDYTFEYFVPAI